MSMDQVLTGTVHGNTIVLDHPLAVPDGQAVEVVVRDRPQTVSKASDAETKTSPPDWWTEEDDRILEEVYQSRKGQRGLRSRNELSSPHQHLLRISQAIRAD
jgi:hypothetical protein